MKICITFLAVHCCQFYDWCLFGASRCLPAPCIFDYKAHLLQFVLLESVQRIIPSNKSIHRCMLGMIFTPHYYITPFQKPFCEMYYFKIFCVTQEFKIVILKTWTDFDPEDRNNIFLQNIDLCLQDFLAVEGQEIRHNGLHRLDRCLLHNCWIIYPFGDRAGHLIVVYPLCNMWTAFEPKYVKSWNTWHFIEKKSWRFVKHV